MTTNQRPAAQPRRKLFPSEAKALLREAVRLNLAASHYSFATRFSAERDEILNDLRAAGYPANIDDYNHPGDIA